MKFKEAEKIVQEERDKYSKELFGKPEGLLEYSEAQMIDSYIKSAETINPDEANLYAKRVYDKQYVDLAEDEKGCVRVLTFAAKHEVWRPVMLGDISTSYIVSSFGQVVNTETDYTVKPHKSTTGYAEFKIHVKGWSRNSLVHPLVARAFIPNPYNKGEVNHIDGNKWNNNVSNLEWNTHAENMRHAYNTGLIRNIGTDHPGNKYSIEQIKQVIELLKNPELTYYNIQDITGVDNREVGAICKHRLWVDLTKDIEFPKHSKASRIPRIGDKHPGAKYTKDKIEEVCNLIMDPSKSLKEIAKITGVHESVVGELYRQRTWIDVSTKYDFPHRQERFDVSPETLKIGEWLKSGKSLQEMTKLAMDEFNISDSKKAYKKIDTARRYLRNHDML